MGCGVFDNTLSERIGDVLEILYPDAQSLPLVLASPHSGCDYPRDFLKSTPLGPLAIRRSEDAFVDHLFALGPKHGVPLIRALFPRAYLDVNREAYELDPEMFEDPLPPFVNAISPRAAIGLGTVPRVVGHNQPIYAGKLRFAEAQERIEELYYPYHARLESLLRDTKRRFGACLLLDCHSMPTSPSEDAADPFGPDIVLGDGFGATCDAEIADTAERVLSELGFVVARNRPYAGGFTTRHYGRPGRGTHALQIEIARRLYMNEETMTPLPCLPEIARRMAVLVEALGKLALPLAQLSGRSAEAAD
ncbi:MAG: N-formylglutamate amidohydrolase [Rhodospirillaceae bacterium]